MSAEPQTAAFSLEMEQELLGCFLMVPEALSAAAGSLQPEHFSHPAHSRLFEVMMERHRSNGAVTMSALAVALQMEWGSPFTEDLTFGQYVAKLGANAAAPMVVPSYVQDLRALWGLRRASDAVSQAMSSDGAASDRLGATFDALDEVRAAISDAHSTRETAGDTTHDLLVEINSIRMGETTPSGATTGFVDLDRVMLGYRPGELIVIGARPGMGKTTFGTSSLLRCAKAGNGVMFFSLELPKENVGARLLADMAFDPRFPLTHSAIRAGKDLTDEQFWRIQEAQAAIQKLPLDVDYAPRLAVAEIAARIASTRKRMARNGVTLRCIGIDYLKFLKATDRYRGQRTYEVGEITAGLKEIAKEQNVCILLLAQLNRGIEAEKDKRPDLHHLRESGDIEADADVVMFLYRPAHYIEKSPEFRNGDPQAVTEFELAANKLEIIVAKNRNGPTTTVNLFCDIGASAIRNGDRFYGGER